MMMMIHVLRASPGSVFFFFFLFWSSCRAHSRRPLSRTTRLLLLVGGRSRRRQDPPPGMMTTFFGQPESWWTDLRLNYIVGAVHCPAARARLSVLPPLPHWRISLSLSSSNYNDDMPIWLVAGWQASPAWCGHQPPAPPPPPPGGGVGRALALSKKGLDLVSGEITRQI